MPAAVHVIDDDALFRAAIGGSSRQPVIGFHFTNPRPIFLCNFGMTSRKEDLVEAIERALTHAQTRLEKHHRVGKLRELISSLTKREKQVFELIVRGKMNKKIAFDLGTTERTVKAHRQKVMEKLNARSVAQLVSSAERLGMFDANREKSGR